MREVEFEGTVHKFPDDFTEAEISAALGRAKPRAAYRNPPSITDYIISTIRQDALPVLGAAAGGTVGFTATGGNPLGGVAGAGLGYAGGQQANRVLESIINFMTGGQGKYATGRDFGVMETAKRVIGDVA